MSKREVFLQFSPFRLYKKKYIVADKFFFPLPFYSTRVQTASSWGRRWSVSDLEILSIGAIQMCNGSDYSNAILISAILGCVT